jgi:hypothetical protein
VVALDGSSSLHAWGTGHVERHVVVDGTLAALEMEWVVAPCVVVVQASVPPWPLALVQHLGMHVDTYACSLGGSDMEAPLVVDGYGSHYSYFLVDHMWGWKGRGSAGVTGQLCSAYIGQHGSTAAL